MSKQQKSDKMEKKTIEKMNKLRAPKGARAYEFEPLVHPSLERLGVSTQIRKYKCKICNYIYDPEKGDPDSGIKPGTPFEALPNDWVCPVCGADKSEFEKMI